MRDQTDSRTLPLPLPTTADTKPGSREWAIALARESGEAFPQGYMNSLGWVPHPWVVDAIVCAWERGVEAGIDGEVVECAELVEDPRSKLLEAFSLPVEEASRGTVA